MGLHCRDTTCVARQEPQQPPKERWKRKQRAGWPYMPRPSSSSPTMDSMSSSSAFVMMEPATLLCRLPLSSKGPLLAGEGDVPMRLPPSPADMRTGPTTTKSSPALCRLALPSSRPAPLVASYLVASNSVSGTNRGPPGAAGGLPAAAASAPTPTPAPPPSPTPSGEDAARTTSADGSTNAPPGDPPAKRSGSSSSPSRLLLLALAACVAPRGPRRCDAGVSNADSSTVSPASPKSRPTSPTSLLMLLLDSLAAPLGDVSPGV
mmetsp:Transcript_13088/g.45776  ORF Transcript_13088/g.45776 Transcript_13088/m.45776 type:complete len:263 (+) Transcript_13088:16-804(+)